MEITDVKIFSANKKGGKLAYANVVLNNEFIIKRIRDICHPLNNELREKITEAIFEAYDEFEKELEDED